MLELVQSVKDEILDAIGPIMNNFISISSNGFIPLLLPLISTKMVQLLPSISPQRDELG